MQERRSETRHMCAEMIMVRVQDDTGTREVVGNIEDISPSGACVQLETAVREGAAIELVCGSCRLRGTVRYCRFVEIGYDLGIGFDPPAAWDHRRWQPRHLLRIPSPVPASARLLRDLQLE